MDNDLVEALRARGVDAMTVSEAGMLGREDHEQLTYATENRRAIYSSNIGHFCRTSRPNPRGRRKSRRNRPLSPATLHNRRADAPPAPPDRGGDRGRHAEPLGIPRQLGLTCCKILTANYTKHTKEFLRKDVGQKYPEYTSFFCPHDSDWLPVVFLSSCLTHRSLFHDSYHQR